MSDIQRIIRNNRAGVTILVALIVLFALPITAFNQQIADPEHAKTAGLEEKMPIGPNVKVGVLDNGLKYYIRKNSRPENRALLRLVVNVGSITEDDDQLGLAHFVEHMAFNGSENFEKQELVDFMESIGMRFGPGLNASTSFDETIYMLQIPTESSEVIETAFQILEDWAHGQIFDHEEIDKERGVVIEEWRMGRGAGSRIRDKQFPIIFKDSQYAQRLPIGTLESLQNFEYESLKRFYRDWYRPDLMGVIVVGDFDEAVIEEQINRHFGGIPNPDNSRPRELYPVPDHDETLFAIATDKEMPSTSVAVYYKLPLRDQSTIGSYRQSIVEGIYNGILNSRLSELVQQADPPFLFGVSNRGLFIRSKEVYLLQAVVREDGINLGLETLLTEAERVDRFGFTQSELDRQKEAILRGIERVYTERDKSNSSNYASEYVRAFLYDESIPGIEYEFELYKRFVPGITLDEINGLGREWISDRNRVIVVTAPEKEGLHIPTEDELLAVFETAASKEIAPYEDTVSDEPLLTSLTSPGQIVSENTIEEIGVTEWELSNGLKVVLKPTDFKEDQIVFTGFSPGGHSLSELEDFIAASSASTVISAGGLGNFNSIDLRKKLTGKVASASASISSLEESISGGASPKDVETMFQLIYLRFTAPRKDETTFQALKAQMSAFFENRDATPGAAFADTLNAIMTQNHPRARQLGMKTLDELDLDKSFEFYKDRFADAGDFTFVFVGNIDLGEFRTLSETYLASLPSTGRVETWRDVGIDPPKGVIKRTVRKGIEPKSQTSIIFAGDMEHSREKSYILGSIADLLDIRLREKLREDLGGTYGVRVTSSLSRRPDEEYKISISFGSDPDRVDELVKVIFDDIAEFKNSGATAENLQKITEAQRRGRETNLKTNGYWSRQLAAWYRSGEDPRNILNYEEMIDRLDSAAVQELVRIVFDLNNYVQISLFPESKK